MSTAWQVPQLTSDRVLQQLLTQRDKAQFIGCNTANAYCALYAVLTIGLTQRSKGRAARRRF
jgi:hypothetical protein